MIGDDAAAPQAGRTDEGLLGGRQRSWHRLLSKPRCHARDSEALSGIA